MPKLKKTVIVAGAIGISANARVIAQSISLEWSRSAPCAARSGGAPCPQSRLVDRVPRIKRPAIGSRIREISALFEEFFRAVVAALAERLHATRPIPTTRSTVHAKFEPPSHHSITS